MMPRLLTHRRLIVFALVVVAVYSLGVLVHVRNAPDVGIQSTFSLEVARFFPEYLREPSDGVTPDLNGAVIRQVGPHEVSDWPSFVRSLRELQQYSRDADVPSVIERNGETWVRVELEHRNGPRFAIWCLLGHPPLEPTLPAVLWLVLQLGLLAVGAIVYWQQPRQLFAGPFFAMTVVAVGAYVGGYHWWHIVTQPLLMLPFIMTAVMLPAVALHFYHVFPRPKTWFGRWPTTTLSAIYVLPSVCGVLLVVGYFWVRHLFRSGATSTDIQEALTWHRRGVFLAFTTSAIWFLFAAAALIHGVVRATELIERRQARWMLIAWLASLVPVLYSLLLAIYDPLSFVGGAAEWPMFIASACVTVGFTGAISRYRWLRLDQVIGSSLSYFLISFLAVVVYYVLVFTAMLIVGRRVIAGPSWSQAFWVSLTTLVMLGIFDLVRSRLNRSLEQYRRDKSQLDRTLYQLSEAIEHLIEPPTLARHLLQATADLLGVSRAAIFLSDGQSELYRLTSAMGGEPPLVELAPGCPLVDELSRRTLVTLSLNRDAVSEQLENLGGEVALAIAHENRLHGFLILGPKTCGFYQAEDYNLLAALAPIGGLAVQSAAARRAIEFLNREVQLKVEKISEQQERIMALQRQLVLQSARVSTQSMPRLPDTPLGLVGSSAVVGQLIDLIKKVAVSPSAVLIRGESGTGKELIARAIHDCSPRAAKPFVKVHCAALSPTLLESELFGHVKGAFTGASTNKVGRFELAHGGTLFLDEIGDINLEVQVKLLRVLQEKVFERVGSSEPVRVDVRIVAATHQNLERLIQQGLFREDLYYRLNVIAIAVPPLRERREDIPELVQYFLQQISEETGRAIAEIDDEAMSMLRNYPWPGNIRQLRNVIERAIVVAEGGLITVDHLPPELTVGSAPMNSLATGAEPGTPRRRGGLSREERLRRQKEELVQALAEAKGNKAEAARALGIPRSTLLSRMQKFGLS
jgi:transcriptional regulator with GAF, ATPase, and Fis domain